MPPPAGEPATELMRIDPFVPGGPFPGGRCARCLESEQGIARTADFEARMRRALGSVVDEQSAAWFAGEIAAGRVCRFRAARVLNRARWATCGGGRLQAALARAYAGGELRRLAARCGRPCPIPVPTMKES